MTVMNKSYHKEILHIALPSILSNITVPLLGLIDLTIAGHLGAASYIGAIAIGGTIFNMIYWIFAFLRMGTSGMTSQAYGADNKQEIQLLLYVPWLLPRHSHPHTPPARPVTSSGPVRHVAHESCGGFCFGIF